MSNFWEISNDILSWSAEKKRDCCSDNISRTLYFARAVQRGWKKKKSALCGSSCMHIVLRKRNERTYTRFASHPNIPRCIKHPPYDIFRRHSEIFSVSFSLSLSPEAENSETTFLKQRSDEENSRVCSLLVGTIINLLCCRNKCMH